MVKAAATCE